MRRSLTALATAVVALLALTAGGIWAYAQSNDGVSSASVAGDTTFVPISPARVYDSRFAGEPGRLGNSANRIISVADQININSGAVIAADIVPANAQAIAFNVTITRTVKTGGTTGGWLSVNPGDATSAGSSTINYTESDVTLANASITDLDPARQVRVFSGPNGTTHFLIDVTGYFVDADEATAPTLGATEGYGLSGGVGDVECQTGPHTPTVPEQVIVHGGISARATFGSDDFWGTAVFSTDGGTIWQPMPGSVGIEDKISTTDEGSSPVHGALDLAAGTTFHFGIQTGSSSLGLGYVNGFCGLIIERSPRAPGQALLFPAESPGSKN